MTVAVALTSNPPTEEPGANPPVTVLCSRRGRPQPLADERIQALLALRDGSAGHRRVRGSPAFATAAPLKAREDVSGGEFSSGEGSHGRPLLGEQLEILVFVPLIELKCSSFSSVRLDVEGRALPR